MRPHISLRGYVRLSASQPAVQSVDQPVFFSLLADCQLAVGCLTSFVSVHLSVNPLVSLLVGLLVCLLDSLLVACQLVCRLVVLSVGIHRPSVS